MTNSSNTFERVLKIVKTFRKIKSDSGFGSKTTDIGYIYLRNNEIDLWMTLESIRNICNLVKCKSMLIVYFDEVVVENGMIFYYDFDKNHTYLSTEIPNIDYIDLGTSRDQNLFEMINAGEFVSY